jgi:hypothetical protein
MTRAHWHPSGTGSSPETGRTFINRAPPTNLDLEGARHVTPAHPAERQHARRWRQCPAVHRNHHNGRIGRAAGPHSAASPGSSNGPQSPAPTPTTVNRYTSEPIMVARYEPTPRRPARSPKSWLELPGHESAEPRYQFHACGNIMNEPPPATDGRTSQSGRALTALPLGPARPTSPAAKGSANSPCRGCSRTSTKGGPPGTRTPNPRIRRSLFLVAEGLN